MSPRLRACTLAATPGLVAATLAGGSTTTWLLVVLVSVAAGAELVRTWATRSAARGAALEVALLTLLVGALAFVVAWGGRLPLQLEVGTKRPAQLLAAALATCAAWALFAPGPPAPEPPASLDARARADEG
ncbi:MAG: hypothetical protein R3F62_26195 [Planctomycetota bacterium]